MGGSREQIGRHCPYCGAIITYDEFFCRACHKRLTDQQNFDVSSDRKPELLVIPGRKTYLAALFAIFGVGLGQFYNGDTIKGLAFGIAFLLVSFGIAGNQYHTILFFAIWALATGDAIWSARRINQYKRTFAGTSYLLYACIFILGAIVALYLYAGQPDMDYLRKLLPILNLGF
jgi:FtsH-binding integral membrane protein